jgi:hypothetical protein
MYLGTYSNHTRLSKCQQCPPGIIYTYICLYTLAYYIISHHSLYDIYIYIYYIGSYSDVMGATSSTTCQSCPPGNI